jgi:hypothetical protein
MVGSGIQDKHPGSATLFESRFSNVKNLVYDSEQEAMIEFLMVGSGIQDKYPGSKTLFESRFSHVKNLVYDSEQEAMIEFLILKA